MLEASPDKIMAIKVDKKKPYRSCMCAAVGHFDKVGQILKNTRMPFPRECIRIAFRSRWLHMLVPIE